jgi:prepilin-type processing-associated H-X9-DG protein
MSIIAILLAILVPALAYARQMGYRIVCLNNLRQLGLATEAYTQSYKYYPLCVPASNETWADFMANPDIAKTKMLGVPASLWPFHKNKKIYDCPVLSKLGCDISYCYNWLAGRDFDVNSPAFAFVEPSNMPTPPPIPPTPPQEKENLCLLNPEKVKSPAIFVLLYDQPIKPEGIVTGNTSYDPYKDIDPDDYTDPCDIGQTQGNLWKYKGVINSNGPHNTGEDILFADGHVKLHKNEKWPDSAISRSPN